MFTNENLGPLFIGHSFTYSSYSTILLSHEYMDDMPLLTLLLIMTVISYRMCRQGITRKSSMPGCSLII